jgi:hypothetical protein
MEPRDFCYWLQGFFELHGNSNLEDWQTQQIQNHLELVFEKHKKTKKLDANRRDFFGMVTGAVLGASILPESISTTPIEEFSIPLVHTEIARSC